ncbi:hypothetical protein V500_05423 [Pseudogymnoascus sp. VKM F-4518 (FW-2643)]|nr:hypothetical protein V500_05423 [Pseudogymnoascus sp. VKM F-4518 (FW-2643)]
MPNHIQKLEIPAIFSSLSEARERLVSQWHVASQSTDDVWDPLSGKLCTVPLAGAWQKKSISILARWSSAYDAYLNIQGENLTDRKRKGTAVLRILKELGSTAMMLTKTTVDDQRSWDVFCSMFQKIVSLAEDIVDVDRKSTTGRPTFCIDMALIGPLFAVKSHSKQALTLLSLRSPVAAEIPSFVGEQSQFFENTIGQKGYGIPLRLTKLLKEFLTLKKLDCRT